MKAEIIEILAHAKTQRWVWDRERKTCCFAAQGTDQNRETLKEQIFKVFRKHHYAPYGNCRVDIKLIMENSYSTTGLIIATVTWTDNYGRIDGIFNEVLGKHVII